MHILSECLNSYQVAFALGKDSKLTQPFSHVIHRLKEGGFVRVRSGWDKIHQFFFLQQGI